MKTFDLQAAARYISLDFPEIWEAQKQEILFSWEPGWLKQYDFLHILDYYGFPELYRNRVLQEVSLICSDPLLDLACYAMYRSLFFSEHALHQTLWRWAPDSKAFREHGSHMTCLVAVLCGQPIHQRVMQERNFDEEQIRLHKKTIVDECEADRLGRKMDGIRFSIMMWCSIFMRGDVIRCGRLQYEVGSRNLEPLTPWAGENPLYIYIHIPGNEPLRNEDVLASFRQTGSKLRRFYPETINQNIVFCTRTWLLSPDLPQLLSPQSNILKFQDKFDVRDTTAANGPFLNFLFDCAHDTPIETLPETSSLQKKAKELLLCGAILRIGLGMLKPEYSALLKQENPAD